MANLDYMDYRTERPPGGKVNDGRSVRVTVPAGRSVKAGELVYLDGWFGIAQSSVEAEEGGSGELVALSIEDCVVSTSKLDGLAAFNALDSCYWDVAEGVVTTTEKYGNPFIGVCVRGLADGTVHIKLAPQPGHSATPQEAIEDATDCAGENVPGLVVSLNAGFKAKINEVLAAIRAAGIIAGESE